MPAVDLSTIRGVRDAVASARVSAVEVCTECLDAIGREDAALHAFNTVTGEQALARAAALDGLAASNRGPLHGVPIALKDNLCTRGVRTTASSRILADYTPPYDATVVERLEQAGAIVIGKTNCDEFAMGSSNENSAFGPVRNPWDRERTPGGSSGGSAAAVAQALVPAALGSDTGGSIRQPAALCGIVGLKPTYGRVSRYGLIAFASSLDQIGPLTRTAADSAALLQVLAGADPRDATAAAQPVPDYARRSRETSHRCASACRGPFGEGVDEDVLSAFEQALGALEHLGATLVDVELPHAGYAIPVYYLVATAEASSNLARYDGVRYGFRAQDAATLQSMYFRTRDEGVRRPRSSGASCWAHMC